MAKFNWKVFKKGKTLYWILGAVVLFVIFYLVASGGSKSSGSGSSGVTVMNAGPTDAQVAASAQAQMAQISGHYQLAALTAQADRDVAVATISANAATAQNTAAAQTAQNIAALQAGVQTADINAALEATRIQSEFSLETSRVAGQLNLSALMAQEATKQLAITEQTSQLAIAKETEFNLGVLDYQLGMRDIEANERLGSESIAADLKKYQIQSAENIVIKGMETSVLNNQIQAGVDVAQINADVATTQILSGERTLNAQLSSNERMFNSSLATQENIAQINAGVAIDQSLIAASAGMKKKDRDNYLISLATGAQYRNWPSTNTGVPAIGNYGS